MTVLEYTQTQYRALEKLYSLTKSQRDNLQHRLITMEKKYHEAHRTNIENKTKAGLAIQRAVDAEERLNDAKNALHCNHEYERGSGFCNKCGL